MQHDPQRAGPTPGLPFTSVLLAMVMVVGILPVSLLTTEADAGSLSGGTYIHGNVAFHEELFNATRTDFRDESVYTLIITRFYDGDGILRHRPFCAQMPLEALASNASKNMVP